MLPVEHLKYLTDIYQHWEEYYAFRGHSNAVLFDFLQPLVTIWRMHELLRQEIN